MISGKVSLRDVAILLQKTMVDQELSASLTSKIDLSMPTEDAGDLTLTTLPPTTVLMDLRIPTKSAGGQMWLKIPNGVSGYFTWRYVY